MSGVLNFIWILFGGWVLALSWIFAGCLAYISVIGIPYGKACFTIAKMCFVPFGKEVIPAKELNEGGALNGPWGTFFNVFWALTVGIGLAFTHAMVGLAYCFTVIGIPVGIQSFKLALISFAPVGKKVVTKEVAAELRRRQAHQIVDNAMSKAS